MLRSLTQAPVSRKRKLQDDDKENVHETPEHPRKRSRRQSAPLAKSVTLTCSEVLEESPERDQLKAETTVPQTRGRASKRVALLPPIGTRGRAAPPEGGVSAASSSPTLRRTRSRTRSAKVDPIACADLVSSAAPRGRRKPAAAALPMISRDAGPADAESAPRKQAVKPSRHTPLPAIPRALDPPAPRAVESKYVRAYRRDVDPSSTVSAPADALLAEGRSSLPLTSSPVIPRSLPFLPSTPISSPQHARGPPPAPLRAPWRVEMARASMAPPAGRPRSRRATDTEAMDLEKPEPPTTARRRRATVEDPVVDHGRPESEPATAQPQSCERRRSNRTARATEGGMEHLPVTLVESGSARANSVGRKRRTPPAAVVPPPAAVVSAAVAPRTVAADVASVEQRQREDLAALGAAASLRALAMAARAAEEEARAPMLTLQSMMSILGRVATAPKGTVALSTAMPVSLVALPAATEPAPRLPLITPIEHVFVISSSPVPAAGARSAHEQAVERVPEQRTTVTRETTEDERPSVIPMLVSAVDAGVSQGGADGVVVMPLDGAVAERAVKELLDRRAAWPESMDEDLEAQHFTAMLQRERAYMPDPSYLEFQPELNEKMRTILLDWMIEVCEEYAFHRETLYMAVNYVDRFLSRVENVVKGKLQLVGITALFLACKQEELSPPKPEVFARVTDGAYTEEDIFFMEKLMLRELQWELLPPTPRGFLVLYLLRFARSGFEAGGEPALAGYASGDLYRRVTTLLDCAVMDFGLLVHAPSVLAASCLLLFHPTVWHVEAVTGYAASDLVPCVEAVRAFLPLLPPALSVGSQLVQVGAASIPLARYFPGEGDSPTHYPQQHRAILAMQRARDRPAQPPSPSGSTGSRPCYDGLAVLAGAVGEEGGPCCEWGSGSDCSLNDEGLTSDDALAPDDAEEDDDEEEEEDDDDDDDSLF